MRIEKITERIKRDEKIKRRFLDNLKCAKSELENLQDNRGFRNYHSDQSHDEIIKKFDNVTDHINDLIEELTEGENNV